MAQWEVRARPTGNLARLHASSPHYHLTTTSLPPHCHLTATSPLHLNLSQWKASGLQWQGVLGAGSYGTVYQAAYGDELLAAKCMHASHQRSAAREARVEAEQELQREFRALSKASHVNIVQLLGKR